MRDSDSRKPTNTPASQDYFEYMFESADLYSALWQPLLKSVGRWHLEVAGLGMKQAQAALQLSRDLSRSWTAADAAAANVRYWESVSAQYAQSSQRLMATVSRSIEQPLLSDVVSLPVRRSHDMIVLPEAEAEALLARKVA